MIFLTKQPLHHLPVFFNKQKDGESFDKRITSRLRMHTKITDLSTAAAAADMFLQPLRANNIYVSLAAVLN